MKPWVASHMERIPFAGIRRVVEKANRLETAGEKVIHFEIGRPDFDTPVHIKEGAKLALDQGLVYYAPNLGLKRLREAIAETIWTNKGVRYDPETEIMVTAGGQEAIFLSLKTLLGQDDEVLLPNPGFGPFASSVFMAGGVPVGVPLLPEHNFQFDLDAASGLVTGNCRAIIVNSPHNPSGSVYPQEVIQDIAAFAQKHELFVISDEAYDRMLYGGAVHVSPASLPGMREQTVMCGSLSKTYAMTGWRIGYIAAPAEFIGGVVRVQQNVMLSVCSFAQAGAVAALTGPQECVDAMMAEFDRRRQAILHALAVIPGLDVINKPEGTFYLFVRHMTPGMTSAQLGDYLLNEAKVAVVDGSSFGSSGEGYFRISYAVSYNDCLLGVERIADCMSKIVK
jgi:aspartate aminotransferase/aminotransferase